MTILPDIKSFSIQRPNDNHLTEVPSDDNNFWNGFYSDIAKLNLNEPIQKFNSKIDPYFGYFGFRFHPIKEQPKYFHTGIDIVDEMNTPIYPIADGVFEYSGNHPINGKYVMLSHPTILTNDGYKMFSLYLHLNKFLKQFLLIQKIFRSIGLRKQTEILILKNNPIGLLGDTGISKGIFTHLHLQIEFRKQGQKTIVIDPLQCFGFQPQNNLTENIESINSLKELLSNSKTITNYKI